MSNIEWDWGSEGVTVTTAMRCEILKFLAIKPQELNGLAEVFVEAQEIYAMLASASASFYEGTADYVNAVDRLKVLRREANKARLLRRDAALSVLAFFDPPNKAAELFNGDDAALAQLASEAIGRLAARAQESAAPPEGT